MPGYCVVVIKLPLQINDSARPLNAGHSRWGDFFVAPGKPRASDARRTQILTVFFREKIAFMGEVDRKKTSKRN
jgi:hypothetical protein